MPEPIYKYSDTGIEKDGHAMFPQDVCKDLQCLQRKVRKLDDALSCKSESVDLMELRLKALCEGLELLNIDDLILNCSPEYYMNLGKAVTLVAKIGRQRVVEEKKGQWVKCDMAKMIKVLGTETTPVAYWQEGE